MFMPLNFKGLACYDEGKYFDFLSLQTMF